MTDLREKLANLRTEIAKLAEPILFRRAVQERLVGYSLEASDEVADAIIAALPDMGRQWQPIETAPKDETALLWSRKFSIIMVAQWGGYCKMNQPEFSHWMPLPAAPVGVQGGEA